MLPQENWLPNSALSHRLLTLAFLLFKNALDFPDINLFEMEAINFALYAWGYMGIFHLSLSSQIKRLRNWDC
jgi:hypothetical protein